jgi:hypothetical protein
VAENVKSLAFQAACVRHMVPSAPSDDIRAGLEQAVKSMEWIERQSELLRMWDDLRKTNPELFSILSSIATTFPGSKIEDIRKLNNG